MALQGSAERNLLSDQLKQAKEMGFTDADLMAALEYNNKNNTASVSLSLPLLFLSIFSPLIFEVFNFLEPSMPFWAF